MGLNGLLNQIGNNIKFSQKSVMFLLRKSIKNFQYNSIFLLIIENIISSKSSVNACIIKFLYLEIDSILFL
jgi:hypothetical protein